MITWLSTTNIGTFYHAANRVSHKKYSARFTTKESVTRWNQY